MPKLPWSSVLSFFGQNVFVQHSLVPLPRILSAELGSLSGSDVLKQHLHRHEPLAKPQSHSTTEAGPIWPAKNPVVITPQSVCPKRGLALVQRDVASPDSQHSTLQIIYRMDSGEPCSELCLVNLLLGPTTLEPGLRSGYAILDGFHLAAARECPPSSGPVSL